ncbi:MAG: MBL fold metallo-hydrolase [Deltaproteobacteria bacterium]
MTRLCVLLASSLLLGACHTPPAAAKPPPKKEAAEKDPMAITVTKVAGAVHLLAGRGGNIAAVVGPDGALIVDDQVPGAASRIQSALATISDFPLRWVVNTHWHWDHTGSNADFGRATTIFAHKNVRVRMSTPQPLRGETTKPSPEHALPVVTYEDGLTIHVGDEPLRVETVPPGHTDGDSYAFFTKSKVVHLGDEFFTARFPFVDLESGGDVVQLEKNISAVIGKLGPEWKIIPGHGPLSTFDDLKAYRDMLRETIASVREQKAAGKKVEQVELDAKWASWGTGYIKTDRWIATIYESLGS